MPKTIAPDIFRQRLLIEGYFERHVDEAALRNARLALITATRAVIASGLAVIGVSAPDSM